ncbi:MAG: hypothetical protein KGD63_10105 [Candidatus Lokiarchaeota archaeon]|nr:hypothetical protein [Candidatus Lokiarchaeota archaeon]
MEIEKKRETSWKIQLKGEDNRIQLTSVEVSGEVRQIRLAIINQDGQTEITMNKEEFFNFLSLISAFKDVVVGEISTFAEEQFDLNMNNDKKTENIPYIDSESLEKTYKNAEDNDLNPKDWDPW